MNTIRNQDELIHSWTRFYLSVQTGLVVAMGFLLNLQAAKNTAPLQSMGPVVISILGIALTLVLTNVIVREHHWQGRYIRALRRLPGAPEIYDIDPDPNRPGYIARQFLGLRWVLIPIWLAVGVFSIGRAFGYC